MLFVKNKKDGWVGKEYVGRPSILGNQFVIGKDGNREEVISKYRVWLWKEINKSNRIVCEELNRLKKLAIKNDINLVCWCAPKRCHAEIIKNCIEWMTKENIEL